MKEFEVVEVREYDDGTYCDHDGTNILWEMEPGFYVISETLTTTGVDAGPFGIEAEAENWKEQAEENE